MPDLVDCVALDLAACNNWFSQNKFYTYITLVDPSQCSFFHLKKKKKKTIQKDTANSSEGD